jgi:hypothetical protein
MTLFIIALGLHIIGALVFVVIFIVSERAYLRTAAPSTAVNYRQTLSLSGERDAAPLDGGLPVRQLGLTHLSSMATRLPHDPDHVGHGGAPQGETAIPGGVMEAESLALPVELERLAAPSA